MWVFVGGRRRICGSQHVARDVFATDLGLQDECFLLIFVEANNFTFSSMEGEFQSLLNC